MIFDSLLDDWIDADDRSVLEAWDEFVSEHTGARLEPDAVVSFANMSALLGQARELGWLELAIDPDTSDILYFEAIKRLHRRSRPMPVPMLEVWSALRILARAEGDAAASLLEMSLTGEAVTVLAAGDLCSPTEGASSRWVPFGDGATVLLAVREGDGVELRAVAPGTASRSVVSQPDPTLPTVTIHDIVSAPVIARLDAAAWAAARAELLVAQSAALAGQAQSQFSDTTAYLTMREQFGVPIGSFQALRHRAADVAADVYAAQQLSIHAAEQLATHTDPLALGYLAKSFTGATAMKTASEAVQLHGGMGFTWEGDVHFGLKRSAYLCVTGLSVGECEERLGEWALAAQKLLWAGGLDSDITRKDGTT